MKRRPIMALAMAAVMAASVMTGCGGSGGGTAATTTASGDTTAAAGETTAEGSKMTPDANAAGQTLDAAISIGQTDAEATPGGTLVVSMPSAPLTLDPAGYTTMYENHIMYNVLETLFIYDKEYKESIPCLATGYEVSDDGLTYTIHLRDDVYFQNGQYVKGRKMTAEDVKYSLERSKSPPQTGYAGISSTTRKWLTTPRCCYICLLRQVPSSLS